MENVFKARTRILETSLNPRKKDFQPVSIIRYSALSKNSTPKLFAPRTTLTFDTKRGTLNEIVEVNGGTSERVSQIPE